MPRLEPNTKKNANQLICQQLFALSPTKSALQLFKLIMYETDERMDDLF